MSRFYLTLPSNSSMHYYPQNTVAQYTTKLNSLSELDGEWEVGLTEISFPFEMENALEGECYFYLSRGDSDRPVKITLPAGHYRTLDEIDSSVKVATMLRMNLLSVENVPVDFSFVKNQSRVRMRLHPNYTVEFGVVLARLLGFRHGITYSETSILANTRMRFRSIIRSIYVYCDLVEHVHVGDTKAPLLRVVNRTYSVDENVHRTFNPMLYVPLQKKCFDSVEINLMTDSGEPVPFTFGKSLVVLEFRRAGYKYFAI